MAFFCGISAAFIEYRSMSLETAYATVFAGMTRQGPGSERSTRKALSLLPPLPESGAVLDLGCGTGASTLVLADVLGRPVQASDVNPASLTTLHQRARGAGLENRITTAVASADATGQPPDSVALIWCEGAIFTVGVAAGLKHWHPILKRGGVVAFTEMCWFGAARPAEAEAFLTGCYPPMTDAASLLSQCFACGYRLEALFALPEADWWDEYLAGVIGAIARHRDNPDPDIQSVIAICDSELDIARRFGTAYGYVFVILSKA
jgi:SAM-dependent methyltransferase